MPLTTYSLVTGWPLLALYVALTLSPTFTFLRSSSPGMSTSANEEYSLIRLGHNDCGVGQGTTAGNVMISGIKRRRI
jgi:uncharacterized membrane protein